MSTDLARYEEEVEVLSVAPSLSSGEVDVQVSTAHRFPRSLTAFRRELLTEATIDAETAGSMFYTLKRGGKTIQGPSSRFAEAALSSWGNLRVSGEIEGEDSDFVYASATAWDLEKNVAIRVRTRRRIRDREGARYGVDMIGTTGAAATSIAIRNAGLKVIPRSAWWSAYLAARSASLGRGTIAEKREHALEWFKRAGATETDVLRYLEVEGLDDIGEEELISLRGLRTAIEDEETTVERAFSREDPAGAETDTLNAELQRETAAAGPTPAETKPAAPPAETKRPRPGKKVRVPKAPEGLGGAMPKPAAPAETPSAAEDPRSSAEDDRVWAAADAAEARARERAAPVEPAPPAEERPFVSREELLRRGPALSSPSAAEGVAVATPKGEPELEAAAKRYRGILETYRPKWTLRHKRAFEESTVGSQQSKWTATVQYDRAIQAILDAVEAESQAAADLGGPPREEAP